jgi:hypothetical protein
MFCPCKGFAPASQKCFALAKGLYRLRKNVLPVQRVCRDTKNRIVKIRGICVLFCTFAAVADMVTSFGLAFGELNGIG